MISQVIIEGIINGSIISLVAVGISLIWGVMNILNFAQGEFLMIGMYIAFFLNMYFGLDPIISVPICMVFMFIIGWIIYKTTIKRVLSGPILSQRLLTFALSIVLANLALSFFGGEYRTVSDLYFTGSITLGSLSISKTKIVPFVASMILSISLYLFINKTRIGKAIQATSMNKEAAALVGIDADFSYALAFSLSAAVTGAAGCILTYYYYVFPGVGATFLLFGNIAVALGGFGSIPGAFFGGIIMGLVDTSTGVYLNTAFKYLSVCFIYIITVSFKPKGLFGR
jgi:branched-chain amino acid transport system permease protein